MFHSRLDLSSGLIAEEGRSRGPPRTPIGQLAYCGSCGSEVAIHTRSTPPIAFGAGQ